MKKLFLLSFFTLSILITSCKKDEVVEIKDTESTKVMYGAKLRPTYDE
jgi:hypothetical protein